MGGGGGLSRGGCRQFEDFAQQHFVEGKGVQRALEGGLAVFAFDAQRVELFHKFAPVFAAAVGVGGEVAGATVGVQAEFGLGIFIQERGTDVGTFGAIQPADGFFALRLRQGQVIILPRNWTKKSW